VYEDLGDGVLDTLNPDLENVRAVVDTVALMHVRFADHPLLADCRVHGGDLGVSFYMRNVRDALHALEVVQPPLVDLQPHQAAIRERLLRHLSTLLVEQPARSRGMAELGGPDTLLHGDLWTTNTLVVKGPESPRVHLIDWDRAGVGPACYDLSTFLLRFPAHHRPAITGLYREAVGRLGWQLAADRELNVLFDTAERARYANCVIWPALAVVQDGAAWGFDALAAVAEWFDALRPVLPGRKGQA
jgi:Ser/Thr protein kinase RdoA (MazF antagonist)